MSCNVLRPWIIVWCALAAGGCRLAASPEAVVAPSVTAAAAAPAAERWLESATLVCLPPAPSVASGSASAAVEQASFAQLGPASPGEASTEPAPRAIPVLAIRYPHPDGRRDVARAELIVADLAAEAEADASWRPRLGRALAGVLPGVTWGPGIRRAAALDVPIAELQQIVAAAQQAAPPVGASTPASTALVRLEVNGQAASIVSPSPAALERLTERVSREGRLISYRGRASELLAATRR